MVFVVHAPASTPAGADVNLVSNLGNWDPALPAHRLTEIDSFTYRLTLTLPVGTALEFKFTRGTFATVEKAADGSEIANRQYEVTSPATVDLAVEAWADLP